MGWQTMCTSAFGCLMRGGSVAIYLRRFEATTIPALALVRSVSRTHDSTVLAALPGWMGDCFLLLLVAGA
eukprot:972356-Amphidinium_carterae.1